MREWETDKMSKRSEKTFFLSEIYKNDGTLNREMANK